MISSLLISPTNKTPNIQRSANAISRPTQHNPKRKVRSQYPDLAILQTVHSSVWQYNYMRRKHTQRAQCFPTTPRNIHPSRPRDRATESPKPCRSFVGTCFSRLSVGRARKYAVVGAAVFSRVFCLIESLDLLFAGGSRTWRRMEAWIHAKCEMRVFMCVSVCVFVRRCYMHHLTAIQQ